LLNYRHCAHWGRERKRYSQQLSFATGALLIKWAAMDSPQHRGISIPGWIGVACIAFYWLIMLVPRRVVNLGPVLDVIGPFGWIILLGMIVLPIVAARRRSKWWFAVAAAGAITVVDLFRHMH